MRATLATRRSARVAPVLAARLLAGVLTAVSAFSCTPPVCTVDITTPDPLPNGGVGHAYFFQMTFSEHNCDFDIVGPIWSARDLPPGMKLSLDGALDGTPTRAGTYTFDVTLDPFSESGTVTRRYTLTIHPA